MLRQKVTPYAFELILAQYTLSIQYRAELLPGQDDVDVWHREYRVVPMPSAANIGTDGEYVYDDSGNLQTDAPEDFGLSEPNASAGRVSSIVACSCQFGESSGLDLCRHRMNRVAALIDHIETENYESLLGVNIATKWLVLTSTDEADATRRLRLQPTPKMFAVPVNVAPAQESASDRYNLILAECGETVETRPQ